MIKNRFSFFALIIICISILFAQFNTISKQSKENPYPIAWDVFGYYLYLPATIIHNDLGLTNDEWINNVYNTYKPSTSRYQYTNGNENKKVIVYNIGYAFVFAPAFIIADRLASPLGYLRDGFTKPYQIALIITGILLSLIGVVMARKIALHFFSDKVSAVLLVCVLLGTNYFFQAGFDNVMPHNILFTLNCFILWYTIQWHQSFATKDLLLTASFIGLASICRPVEILWLIIPMFYQVKDLESFIAKLGLFNKHYKQIVLGVIVLLSIVFIQFAYYKYAVGFFRVFNLHSESFDFLHPFTFKFLFSYKKGWLLYTPIMLFGLVGFYFLFKNNRNNFWSMFLFFILNLYVVSSWQCWWYAASFSQRPMVESYVMMLVPFGYFIDEMSKWRKLAQYFFAFLLILFASLNIFQTYQYLHFIIDGERMTKTYYWKVFGKTNIDGQLKNYLSVDRNEIQLDKAYYRNTYFKKEIYYNDFEDKAELHQSQMIDSMATSGKNCYVLDDKIKFSPAMQAAYSDITNKSFCWISASVNLYIPYDTIVGDAHLIISIEALDKAYSYSSSAFIKEQLLPHKWNTIALDIVTPEILHNTDMVKVYFWNNSDTKVLIDDLKVNVYEPKIEY
jgi:hypothetical protein